MSHWCLRAFAAVIAASLLGSASASAADPPSTRTTPIVVHVDRGGFSWSDAGIGALAGVGGALVLTGAMALLRSPATGDARTEEGERS